MSAAIGVFLLTQCIPKLNLYFWKMSGYLHSVIPKLPAADLQATKSFYIDKLSFRQNGDDYPDYLMVYRDKIELHFFLDCELDLNHNDGMCYIRISGIEQFYEELKKSLDNDQLGELQERSWHQKEFSPLTTITTS